MTQKDRQIAALSEAVAKAMKAVGSDALKMGDFFGIRQCSIVDAKKAA